MGSSECLHAPRRRTSHLVNISPCPAQQSLTPYIVSISPTLPPALSLSTIVWRYVRQFVKMDAKEALQYVYCIPLSSDQGSGIGKEQVEIAWELTRRIIVLANGGPAWEELVGGIRPDGGRFVSPFPDRFFFLHSNANLYSRPVSSNKARIFSTLPTPISTTKKFSRGQLSTQKRTTASSRPSSYTTSPKIISPLSPASHKPSVTRLHKQLPTKRRAGWRRLPQKF